jgi:hypothetical protein
MFEAQAATAGVEMDLIIRNRAMDFCTPVDPEAGWAARNPERALLFLYVSPRDCGALEELMAV